MNRQTSPPKKKQKQHTHKKNSQAGKSYHHYEELYKRTHYKKLKCIYRTQHGKLVYLEQIPVWETCVLTADPSVRNLCIDSRTHREKLVFTAEAVVRNLYLQPNPLW